MPSKCSVTCSLHKRHPVNFHAPYLEHDPEADGSELLAILEYGVAGMDEDGNRQDKPVVNGTYELTVIRETDEIESLESGIDGLVILTVIDATST